MSESKISCPHCDQHIQLDDAWAGRTVNCPACAKPIQVPSLAPEPVPTAHAAPAPQPAGLRIDRPQASSAPPSLPPGPAASRQAVGSRQSATATAPRTSGLAIASLILSILGCFGITALAAVICGHMARKRIRDNPSLGGNGLALAGLIIGYLMLAFSAVWGTMFAIGVARGFNEARQMAQQRRSEYQRSGPAEPGSEWAPTSARPTAAPPRPPDAVSGTLNGTPFAYSKSTLATNMGLLSINDGANFIPDRQVLVFLFPKQGESFENRTWNFSPSSPGQKPHVHLRWMEGEASKSTSMTSGYQMQLQTGAIKDGVITGSLNLKIAGEVPVELNGTFSAAIE